MDEHDEAEEEPRRRRRRTGREAVRIIKPDEAAAALGTGQAVGRRSDEGGLRYGDVPPAPSGPRPAHRFPLPDSVDPAEVSPRPAPGAGGAEDVRERGEPDPSGGWERAGADPFAVPYPAASDGPEGEHGFAGDDDLGDDDLGDDDLGAGDIRGDEDLGWEPDLAGSHGTSQPRPAAGIEMPHWTDPPTGEVPVIVPTTGEVPTAAPTRQGHEGDDDFGAWADLPRSATWRGDRDADWDDPGYDPSSLGSSETRLGALDPERGDPDDLFSFDAMVPPPGAVRGGPQGGAPGGDDPLAGDEEEWRAGGRSRRAGRRRWRRGRSGAGRRAAMLDTGLPEVPGPEAAEAETARAGETGHWASDETQVTETGAWAPHGDDADLAGSGGARRSAATADVGAPGAAAHSVTEAVPEARIGAGAEAERPAAGEAPAEPPLRRIRSGGLPPGAPPPGEPPETAPGRTSRGATRVATGVGIGILALILFKVGPVASLALDVVLVTLALAEFYAVVRRAGYRPATLVGLVATVCILVAGFEKGQGALAVVVALTAVVTLLWYLMGIDRSRPTVNLGATMLGFIWIGFLGSYAGLLLNPRLFPHRHGIAFLLGAAIAAVAYDVGALIVGSLWGRHPMAPSVSPNKTWEGMVGGVIACLIFSIVVVGRIDPWDTLSGLALGIMVSVIAPLGDLCESMVKRDLGIKDMGSLLPGHGGVLDRIDALLFVLPATFYLVRVLNIG